MSAWHGVIWVIECDHKPLVVNGLLACFPSDDDGTQQMRAFLNTFPTDGKHYYDGVLYERLGPK